MELVELVRVYAGEQRGQFGLAVSADDTATFPPSTLESIGAPGLLITNPQSRIGGAVGGYVNEVLERLALPKPPQRVFYEQSMPFDLNGVRYTAIQLYVDRGE